MSHARYDQIGEGYAAYRRPDPEIQRRIDVALAGAKSVVNVGAGTGSYEPEERYVIAIEPSDVMAAQRPPERAPAIRAFADDLPLRDQSVDAAMSVLSLHHWDDARRSGVEEMRRVARGAVVIVTYDPRVSAKVWLLADYLPEVAALDFATFPLPETLVDWLGGATIEPIPLAATTPDWMLGSFWAHPERVLDAGARNATSGFARQPESVVRRVVDSVRRDLGDGSWDARYGYLRQLERFDVGLRLIVSPGLAR
ncbi:MAG: class I SAM-dependent methyltransferase [Myxococcales bacterium]|nr:class I SAM-dependent methyltransferase [Myxococcales bacterium]